MRIISCYITGYGKLHNESFDFTDGFNVIKQDNSWGKTTLCSFVKAMFYGIPESRVRKELVDRKHYAPWDKGAFGGNLVFQVGDKTYRVERFFGKNARDDEFQLIDEETGLDSQDYSSNLGEELFGIDTDSFAKTVFVPQNALETGMTDKINGKMGDLVTVQDDINNFDEAIKRIDNEISIYNKNGKDETRGKSLKIKDEIAELAEDVERMDSYVEAQHRNMKLLDDKQNELAELEKNRQCLREQIANQSVKEQSIGEYKTILKQYNEEKVTLDELDDYFANGIPEQDELKTCFDDAREIDVNQRELDGIQEKMPDDNKIEELKQLFSEPIEDTTIDSWMERANKLSELRVQKEHAQLSEDDKDELQQLKYYFSKKVPTKEELEIIRNEAEQANRLEGRIDETKQHYELQKQIYEEGKREFAEDKSNKSTKVMLSIIGLIVLIGGIASLILVKSIAGIILGIAGIAIAVVILVVVLVLNSKKTKKSQSLIDKLQENYREAKNKYEQAVNEYKASEEICNQFLSDFLVNANDTKQQMIADIQLKAERYATLQSDEQKAIETGGNAVEELTNLQMALYTELMHYQVCYGLEDLYTSNDEINLIQRIKEDNQIFINYFEDDSKRSKLIEVQDRLRKSITTFIGKYPYVEGDNLNEKIAYIAGRLRRYEELSDKVAGYKDYIDEFTKEYDMYEEAVSVEELQEQQSQIDEAIMAIGEDINKTREQLRNARESIDECQEKSNRIDELKEILKEYDVKVDYLKSTKKYLSQAKERFLSKYIGPLQKAMREYIAKIDGDGGMIASESFKINTNLGVSIDYEGSSKTADYLSEGYRDLAALAARFALIDVMYDAEQPMIVLDDPFTNLDENKIKLGLQLVKNIAEDRQVLYFTCHESRA